MFKSIKKFFGFGNSAAPEVTTQAAPAAPYKVETPTLAVPTTPVVVAEVAPVAPAAKPKAARKPAAAKAPAKAKTLKVVK